MEIGLRQVRKYTHGGQVWRERIIPTERPPLISEGSVNFLLIEDVAWSA
jgi:hypothetical protein